MRPTQRNESENLSIFSRQNKTSQLNDDYISPVSSDAFNEHKGARIWEYIPQIILTLVTVVYFIMPDFFPGLTDDVILAIVNIVSLKKFAARKG